MKTTTSLVVLSLVLAVAAPTVAQERTHDHLHDHNWQLEIEDVTTGMVTLKTLKAQKLQCPAKGVTVVQYDLFEAWPAKVKLDAMKESKTHVIVSGSQKLTLTGVNSPRVDKEKRVVTVTFEACK